MGALTRPIIASKPQHFIGIEIDGRLFESLQNSYPSVLFLNQDILQTDLSEVLRHIEEPPAKLKVVGNLPYYISSPTLDWLGRQSDKIESATIMLQAEVADRLVAVPGNKDFGVLTLLSNYYFTIAKLMDVRPGAFRPVPRVYSTVVRLKPKFNRELDLEEESAFFSFLKQSFSQRRKTLWNCHKGSVDRQGLEAVLIGLGHSPNSRGEVLSLGEFLLLFKQLRQR